MVHSLAAAELSDQEISECGGCYFAPITSGGIWRMRTQDGEFREFEPDVRNPGRLVGVGGWWAKRGEKNEVSVHAPASGVYPPMVYNFRNGRLASLDVQGKHCRFSYPDPLVYDDGVIPQLWSDAKAMTREEFAAKTTMWKDGSRLTLWFASPNQAGVFCSFLFFAFLGVFLAVKSRVLRWGCVGLALAAFVLLALTASRGGILGTAIGAAAVLLCDSRVRRRFASKKFIMCALGAMLVAICAVAAMYRSARDAKADRQSDATRRELWGAAPAMICDAADGWGGYGSVGRAYSDWYAPPSDSRFRLNLVSDHLTMLAGHGWVGRWFYVFSWVAGLAFLFIFAWRGGNAAPLAIWLSLAVGAALNVVMFERMILWIPIASLLVLAFDRRWLRWRVIGASLAFGAVASSLALIGLVLAGNRFSPSELPIEKSGNAILVNGDSPDIWIVDDGEAIGGVLAPREIRAFYRKYPSAPAIGYVTDIDDVPANGVKRLVLVGDSAQYFMVPYTHGQNVQVPREIIFLSPQFPPEAIPDDLRREANVIMVIGEFAARYWGEYAEPLDWVEVVPGAEVYIPGWMGHCVETETNGGERQ